MNNLKIIFLISFIAGGILGTISLVPFAAKSISIILLTVISVPLIYWLKKLGFVAVFNEKESLKTGALTGVFSTLGFCFVFYPIVYVLSLIFKMEYLGGFSLMVRLMSLPLALMFVIFICIISAIFNSFSALMYYYIEEGIKNLK